MISLYRSNIANNETWNICQRKTKKHSENVWFQHASDWMYNMMKIKIFTVENKGSTFNTINTGKTYAGKTFLTWLIYYFVISLANDVLLKYTYPINKILSK